MKLNINTHYQIDENNLQEEFKKLFSKKIDVLTLNKFINLLDINSILDSINNNIPAIESAKLLIPDGYFYPYPYSTIQGSGKNADDMLKNYFTKSILFNEGFSSINLGSINKWYVEKLETIFGIKLINLKTEYGLEFAKLNLRILESGKNGIDIHCENAFIHQLIPSFSNWLKKKVNLEHALSVFTVIQKAEIGGELFLYSLEWDNFKHKLNESSYEERHDVEGSFFTSRGIENPEKTSITLEAGDTVIFRAAQIWHAINKIDGKQNRITLGCFIAEGYDNNFYYWS